MNHRMSQALGVSAQGLDFIKGEEGLRLGAYQDCVGIWTIGYGHTHKVLPSDRITREEAEQLLRTDLIQFERVLNQVLEVPVNQNQFNALASLIFNIGPGCKGMRSGLVQLKDGRPSTLLASLNRGAYEEAANQFSAWIYAGGKVLKGLILRRERERELFLS